MSTDDALSWCGVPPPLVHLFTNSIILDCLISYLTLPSIFSLARTCRSLRDLLFQNPRVFRYIDLSRCRGAYVPPNLLTRIDSGGHSWRAERMDENLTEDEFYAGPLRGVLGKLGRMGVLKSVQTLVLDELASVTHDLINDIVLAPEYNVRLLSIRRCLNVNHSKVQQLLRHICRPSRPEGTPRLQGLYVFTHPASSSIFDNQTPSDYSYLVAGQGASGQLGPIAASIAKLRPGGGGDAWYSPSGQVISLGHAHRTSWEETLLACKGIISFDAVLCTHMHADMAPVLHVASRDYLTENKAGIPPLATIALGPNGCASCGRAPRDAPVWGESDPSEFPLLWPPPVTGRLVDAVRPPLRRNEHNEILPQRLIVSCTWCLTNRHCESCHRWWCADCYNPTISKKLNDLERLSQAGLSYLPSMEELDNTAMSGGRGDHIKQQQQLRILPGQAAVTRDCFECGRVCGLCAPLSTRICKRCKSSYCLLHNTGCDEEVCDWCMFRGGRRTRELY
ncbi:hypothetical protein ABEF93_000163 [Exophiala dermatitidis]